MQRTKAKLALAYIEQKYANLRTENLERAESQKRADILELKMEEMGINEQDKGRYCFAAHCCTYTSEYPAAVSHQSMYDESCSVIRRSLHSSARLTCCGTYDGSEFTVMHIMQARIPVSLHYAC